MRAGGNSNFEFLIVSMKTDSGIEGHSLGFAGRGADMAGAIAATALKPFFEGKDPLFREQLWQDFRTYDRWWNHVPIYSYGPFDICLWDIAGKMCGLPLYKLLGAYRDKVPVYASSFVLDTPEDYARQALEAKTHRWHAYKLHPPGRVDLDLAAYRACREAVGPDFKLMADPVAAYSYEEALRVGRELERLNYYWFEEPLPDTNFHGLRKLHDCARHSRLWHRGSARFPLFDRAMHFGICCRYRANRRLVEGRRNARYENCPPGGIFRRPLRGAHRDLSCPRDCEPALLRGNFELRVSRTSVPHFGHEFRHEACHRYRCEWLCSSTGSSRNRRGLGLGLHRQLHHEGAMKPSAQVCHRREYTSRRTVRGRVVQLAGELLLACVILPGALPQRAVPAQSGAQAEDGYIGSRACARCHPSIYESFSRTDMGRSMSEATGESLARIPQTASVAAPGLNRRYEVYTKDEKLYQSEFAATAAGKEVFRETRKLDYLIGSGANGIGAIVKQGEYLFEAPLSFYAKPGQWALSPGYEFGDYGFNRPILTGCIACHSGRARIAEAGSGRFQEPPFEELAIGCENCHGPGEAHVIAADTGVLARINRKSCQTVTLAGQ